MTCGTVFEVVDQERSLAALEASRPYVDLPSYTSVRR